MQLSIITLGHVHAEELAALTPHFDRIEQLVLDVAPRDALSRHRPELNRAIDAATADWILIVRERETIDEPLAAEIGEAMKGAKAWGFRVRSVPHYDGKPLLVGSEGGGEVRLFHKRHYLRFANKGEWQELSVQGTVIRLTQALRSVTFESTEAHRQYLAGKGVAHSALRRLLLFLRYLAAARTVDRSTLRYLWIEASFDSRER
jgi:hypothetical protein